MADVPWEFWIDVGGTFTDCLAQTPGGRLLRHKLLSSGVVKGAVGDGSSGATIVDSARVGDPSGFWIGSRITLLDDGGRPVTSGHVADFDANLGRLDVSPPIDADAHIGGQYELTAGFEAPILAIRYVLGLPPTARIPPIRLRLGTTRGTNALLTRTGARTALAVTRGFGDLLEIGNQDRPRLFDLTIRKSPPLAECTIEIDERVGADGAVLIAPDAAKIRAQLDQLFADGIASLAVCLLHADLFPAHEELVEQLAREAGFEEISRSSDVAPLVKIVSRADTTVADAYLNPILRSYVAGLEQALPGSQIRLMTSAGGLVAARAFRGYQSVLSGPAGGVVGYARAAEAIGRRRAIGFDMGGTSTDVSRYEGQVEYEYETQKAGVRLVAPTLAIETVAAGGGSICSFDGVKLVVGPKSAGADPGPACYGRGGPLCVTDLNLFLGRIVGERFPFPLDRAAVERRLDFLAGEVASATGERLTRIALAEGLFRIANANMARAIRSVSVAKGSDPRDYLLVAFGGAAAQHACAVAGELGIKEILHHPDASLMSARGIGLAQVTRHAAVGVYRSASDVSAAEIEQIFSRLEPALLDELKQEGFTREQVTSRRTLDLRYAGVDATISVPFGDGDVDRLPTEFERLHRQQFGYAHAGRDVEIASARVEVVGASTDKVDCSQRVAARPAKSIATTEAFFSGGVTAAAVYAAESLPRGATFDGPALIAASHSTIVVEPGWTAEVLSGSEVLLSRRELAAAPGPTVNSAPEAVLLEVFNNLLAGVAERMGHVLRRTAISVNVKERLDYSCAVFTAAGELVANAPHIPVHLGAMGATVRAVIADNPDLRPGDVVATNDPYRGGSHLPDVTVVMPVHEALSGRRVFFVACRAHHAEIGGVRPGSMPPRSRRLAEEGVVISNFLLVRDGAMREAELRSLLTSGPYPSRCVEENLADMRAQVAALKQGAADLEHLVEQHGRTVIERQMHAIQAAAETKVRRGLAKLPEGAQSFVDYLETADGQSVPLCVTARLSRDPSQPAAVFDFAGTSGVVDGNLNANSAIVSAAVLYVLRLLLDEDIPLNEGALKAVEIILPPGLLNPPAGAAPAESPAVAAGNVETSQRVVDVLLGALGLAAASQGTMNNVLFGNEHFGFYETVCGGSGATAAGSGADAVQVHMTNTRATDPEVLERRLPVRLWEFSVRRGSGGPGRRRGGDGAVRRIEFLAPLELSLITQRRGPHPPFGLNGGKSGSLGENMLLHHDGTIEELSAIAERNIVPGDMLVLKTPGGGGFGLPSN